MAGIEKCPLRASDGAVREDAARLGELHDPLVEVAVVGRRDDEPHALEVGFLEPTAPERHQPVARELRGGRARLGGDHAYPTARRRPAARPFRRRLARPRPPGTSTRAGSGRPEAAPPDVSPRGARRGGRGGHPRMRSPRGSRIGSRTRAAARRSPRISTVNSAPSSSISSTGTNPRAMLSAAPVRVAARGHEADDLLTCEDSARPPTRPRRAHRPRTCKGAGPGGASRSRIAASPADEVVLGEIDEPVEGRSPRGCTPAGTPASTHPYDFSSRSDIIARIPKGFIPCPSPASARAW